MARQKSKVDVGTTKPKADNDIKAGPGTNKPMGFAKHGEGMHNPVEPKPKAKSVIPSVTITAIDPMALEASAYYLRLCKMRPNSKRFVKKIEKDIAAIKTWQKANTNQVGYR